MLRSKMNRTLSTLFLILSTLLCYLSIYDEPGSLNADVLSPLSLSLEVSEGFKNLGYWNYSGYTAWFPDVASVVLLGQLFGRKYILLANIVWGLIQIGTFQYCNIKLIGLITNSTERKIRVSVAASVSIIIFFALSDRRLLAPIIYPIHHFPAFLLSLLLLILYFEIASTRHLSKTKKILFFLSVISICLVTLSDPFFVLFGGIPIVLSHIFFRCFGTRMFENRLKIILKFDYKRLDLLCGLVTVSSIAGYGLYKLTPVSNGSYFGKSGKGSLDSIQSFLNQLTGSPQTLLILVAVISLAAFTLSRHRSSNQPFQPCGVNILSKADDQLLSFYAFFTLMSTLLCVVFAVGIYGLFSDFYSFRYIQILTFCPPVLIGISLLLIVEDWKFFKARLKNKLKRFSYLILAVIAALDLALAASITQEYISHTYIQDQNLACIRSLGIDHYAAEYWWAKPVHVLSGGKIKPIQLTANADYYPWVNSERWYEDLNQLDGTLGVLVEADGRPLIDSQQVSNKTSASIPKQCGNLSYLLSAD